MTDISARSETMAAAEALYEIMKTHDPDPGTVPPWSRLSEHTRYLYVSTLEEVMRARILAETRADSPPLSVRYVNYKGRESDRSFIPGRPFFGATEHHPVPQWLVPGVDAETGNYREFAMDDMCGRNLADRLRPAETSPDGQP